MTEETRSWPVGLRRLADVIGPAAAVRLADAFGGIEKVYIPKTANADHLFTDAIGLDRLERLCAEFGGQQIDIPRGTFRDLKKAAIIDAAGSNRDVALRLRCTQRYVRIVRADLRDAGPDLFSAAPADDDAPDPGQSD